MIRLIVSHVFFFSTIKRIICAFLSQCKWNLFDVVFIGMSRDQAKFVLVTYLLFCDKINLIEFSIDEWSC